MIKKICILFVVIPFFISCSLSETGEEEVTDNFDRITMLVNIADNIIIPAYDDFNAKMTALKTAGETFTANANQTNLETLRTSWLAAYTTWQQVEMFNVGKAEELQYSSYMNIYPSTVATIETNITSGNYNLENDDTFDIQGFPALDYLLYGVADSDAEILVKFTSNENADAYKKYMTAILA